MNNERPYKVTGGDGFLNVRISGAAYQNLAKMAEALNSTEPFDKDNTAETVADAFFFCDLAWKLADPKDALEEALTIADAIDTDLKDGTEEDEKVKDSLRAAFKKVLAVPS